MKKELDAVAAKANYIVAKAILDTKFGVSQALLNETTGGVIVELIKLTEEHWLWGEYTNNWHFRWFTQFVRETMKPSNELYEFLNQDCKRLDRDELRILFFRNNDWVKMCKNLTNLCGMEKSIWLIDTLELALANPNVKDPTIHCIYDILSEYVELPILLDIIIDDHTVRKAFYLDDAVRLMYIIGANNNYETATLCLEKDIPVLFKYYDATDLAIYLDTVLATGYRGMLDENIKYIRERIPSPLDRIDIEEDLWEIGTSLNQNNFIFYTISSGIVFDDPKTILHFLRNEDWGDAVDYEPRYKYDAPARYLTRFEDLVAIHGEHGRGFNLEIQEVFLEHGGILQSMFHDVTCTLRKEATLIKMNDKLPRLLELVSMSDIEFLFYWSPDFVKNIMMSENTLTIREYIKIARAIFIMPVEEGLYAVLNDADPYTSETVDYRIVIVNQIVSALSREVLFNNVPEAMAYIEPSVLYITEHIATEPKIMTCVSVTSLTPYIKDYLVRNEYTEFNLIAPDDYLYITDAVDDWNFFVTEILLHGKKFGYLEDMDLHGYEPEDREKTHNFIQLLAESLVSKEN